MKIFRNVTPLLLLMAASCYANDYIDIDGSISGLRQDAELRWNIGSSPSGNTTPNILSELTFDELTIAGTSANVTITIKQFIPGLYLEASTLKGSDNNGAYQDSDYAGDNRSGEFSRSVGTAQADIQESKAAIGYSFILPVQDNSILSAKIMLGLADNEQDVTITNGVQTIDTIAPVTLGAFSGLHATYDAEWKSKWLGLELDSTSFNNRHKLFYRAEYHRADYSAVANWNLNSNFMHPKSFTQEADGTGIVLQLGYTFYPTSLLGFHISYGYEKWTAEDGIDTAYLSAGGTSSTLLREAVWQTKGIRVGFDLKI